MFKKIVLGLFIVCGISSIYYESNKKELHKKWHVYKLNKELKDVYSHSRYYEKMARHGLSISESKWEELHDKANNIKAEIAFIKGGLYDRF